MLNTAIITGVAVAATASGLALASPASAGPAGPGSARATIAQLEQLGNRVIVKRLSDATLSQASVVSVQPGPDFDKSVWNAGHDIDSPATDGQVVYVAVR